MVAWAGALGAWGTAGLGGCAVAESAYAGNWVSRCASFPAGTVVSVDASAAAFGAPSSSPSALVNVTEPAAFVSCTLACPPAGTATATPVAWIAATGQPVAWATSSGLLAFGSPFGSPAAAQPYSDPGDDAHLATPHPLLAHVQAGLDAYLSSRALFSCPGLTWTAARASNPDGTATYSVLVSNPTMAQAPLNVTFRGGGSVVVSFEELPPVVPDSVKSAIGYLPDGFQGTDLGNSTPTTIAGVDTRAFRVVVRESQGGVSPLPTAPAPPRPRNVALAVGSMDGLPVRRLRDLVALYPSLQQMFDFFVVDWEYVRRTDAAHLAAEGAYLAQTGFRGVVDFTSGLNLFPTLRLFNNSAPEYAASLDAFLDVINKTATMGWRDVVFSLHRTPENNMDDGTAIQLMGDTLTFLYGYASALNVTIHLRAALKSPVGNVAATLSWLGTQGLQGKVFVMPNTGAVLSNGDNAASVTAAIKSVPAGGGGLLALLGVSCPRSDPLGSTYTDTAPLTVGCSDAPANAQLVQAACAAGVCNSYAPDAAKPNVLLVVDAFTSADALGEPEAGADFAPDTGPDATGPWLGPGLSRGAAGAALDLAYAEALWLLAAAGIPSQAAQL